VAPEYRAAPEAAIKPRIDGKISSYFEWLGAGVYRLDGRSGSMHATKSPVREVQYGSDGARLYLRIDFHDAKGAPLTGIELRLRVEGAEQGSGTLGSFDLVTGGSFVTGSGFPEAQCAYQNIFEASVPAPKLPARFQFSLWKDGLPMDAIPQQGWLETGQAEEEA
jgi:hypothetical protein